jgi:hypothetical protein
VALRFAEVLAGDHREATDSLFDETREHFTESDIVDLGWRIVAFLGYGRLIHVVDLEVGKACPIARPPDSEPMKKVEKGRELGPRGARPEGEL